MVRTAPLAEDLVFHTPSGNIRVAGGGSLVRSVRLLLPDWTIEASPPASETAISVVRDDTGYRVGTDGEWFASARDAAFSVVNRVLTTVLARAPYRASLHAAGVLASATRHPEAVMLVGETHAGKSTLALTLAAAGRCILGDDAIQVDAPEDAPPTAASFGLAPKVRLPLPAGLPADAGAYVAEREAARIADVAYLHPRTGEMAPFGRAYPLTALVLLERVRPGDAAGMDEPAALTPLSRSMTVRGLLRNCFAPHLSSAQRLRMLAGVTEAAACHRLRFHDSAAAASLIRETFA